MLRYLRYLRIAFSATSLVACVLLIALCVRSYRSDDHLLVTVFGNREVQASSIIGRMAVVTFRSPVSRSVWRVESRAMSTGRRQQEEVLRQEQRRFNIYFAQNNPAIYGVAVPHWFPVLVLAALAAAPWIRWSRRFSLRTLLIATTLVAVVLGIFVVLSR